MSFNRNARTGILVLNAQWSDQTEFGRKTVQVYSQDDVYISKSVEDTLDAKEDAYFFIPANTIVTLPGGIGNTFMRSRIGSARVHWIGN